MNFVQKVKKSYIQLKNFFSQEKFSLLICLSVIMYYLNLSTIDQPLKIKLSVFLFYLCKNLIEQVTLKDNEIIFKIKNKSETFTTNISMVSNYKILKLLRDKKVVFNRFSNFEIFNNQIYDLTQSTFLLCFSSYILIRVIQNIYLDDLNFQFNIKYKYQLNLKDIVGMDTIKQELEPFINFMNNNQLYANLGARQKKGIIFQGQKGQGKKYFAKALAGETKSNFIYCALNHHSNMYQGFAVNRINQVFEKARNNLPCIVYFDSSLSQTQQNTDFSIKQIIKQLENIQNNDCIIVILDCQDTLYLDSSLFDKGMFETLIEFDFPNKYEKYQMLHQTIYQKSQSVSERSIKKVAENSFKFSREDVMNIVNESAYISIANYRKQINDLDLVNGLIKVMNQKRIQY